MRKQKKKTDEKASQPEEAPEYETFASFLFVYNLICVELLFCSSSVFAAV